jgi:hypothetical protein
MVQEPGSGAVCADGPGEVGGLVEPGPERRRRQRDVVRSDGEASVQLEE